MTNAPNATMANTFTWNNVSINVQSNTMQIQINASDVRNYVKPVPRLNASLANPTLFFSQTNAFLNVLHKLLIRT
jgi:hypothetical protein